MTELKQESDTLEENENVMGVRNLPMSCRCVLVRMIFYREFRSNSYVTRCTHAYYTGRTREGVVGSSGNVS